MRNLAWGFVVVILFSGVPAPASPAISQDTEACLSCHASITLSATKILMTAWEKGVAKGLGQKDSIFNEAIEKNGWSNGFSMPTPPVLLRPWPEPTTVSFSMVAGTSPRISRRCSIGYTLS